MKIITLALSLALLALIGCAGPKESLASSAKPEGAHMNQQSDNKRTVSKFFEEFSSGNIENSFSLVSDSVIWWVPGTLPFSGNKTKTQYLQVVGAIRNGFPTGFTLKVTGLVAEADKVAAEVESFGTHVNGKAYNNKYHFLITLNNGKFVEVKEYMDTLHLFQLIQK